MKRLLLVPTLALGVSTAAHAVTVIASDIASNYGGSWTNGTDGGTGFGAWAIFNNNGGGNFAGTFIGDSTAGGGNVNTRGVSFGLYANPSAAAVNATRSFDVALASGNTFTFKFTANFDNGNKGFDFFAGGDGTVLNFNLGSGAGVSSSKSLSPTTSVVYDYGGSDAVFDVTLTMMSSSSFFYDIRRTSSLGTQGTLFSGNVSGLTQGPTGIGFYVAGTDAGGAAQNNLYVNSLSVVPEPTTLALFSVGLAGVAIRRRKYC